MLDPSALLFRVGLVRWRDQKRRSREQVTCVLCRAPWAEAGGKDTGKGVRNVGG
jgi:hypothetical protein